MDEFFGVSDKKYSRILKQLQGQPFTRDAEETLIRYKDMLNDAISSFDTEYITTEKDLNNMRNSVEHGMKPYKPSNKMWYEGKISSLNNLIKDTQSLANELKHTDNVDLNQVSGIINKYGEKIAGPQRARLESILKSLGKANRYLNVIPLGELSTGVDYLPLLDLIMTKDENQYNKKLQKMFNDAGINYSNGQFQL